MPLDIGVGILLAMAGANIFNVALSWPMVAWGIMFALLPDVDVIPELIARRGKLGGKEISWHRELAHFPIIYIVPAVLVFVFAGRLYGFLFALGVFLHLLHDSIGMGWGIEWAWPFNKNSYKFFSDERNEMSWRVLIHWTPEELPVAVRTYGKPDWIKRYYFQLHPIVIVEIIVFVLALVALYLGR
jgi:hypothetical protein